MGKIIKVLFGLVVLGILALIAIQFIPYGHADPNPKVMAEPKWDSPRTRELFFRVCRDCHSNETIWPWYTQIAPASWLIARDVSEGRDYLNVSEWGQSGSGDESAEVYAGGRMPPWFFMPMHPEANLNPADREAFIKGLQATFGGGE